MTCAELKEQAAALALGQLGPDERAAVERHLAEAVAHEGCVEAVRQASEAATLLALALPPVAPAAATWSAIEAGTRTTTALPPRRARAWTAAPWLVAAAAALACAWALRERGVLRHEAEATRATAQAAAGRADQEARARAQCVSERDAYRRNAELQKEALALLARPGAKLVPLAQQNGASASASVVWHPEKAFVLGRNMAAPAGRDYELWMIRGDKKIPAGLLRGDGSGALVTAIDPGLLAGGAPDAIAVTLEAAGGRPQPEGPIVLVGKI
jgi:hypothetical protein